MPKLSDMLYDAEKLALATGKPQTVALQGGLTVVIDYTDPACRQVRLGRRWPTWPSAVELSTIRRYVSVPPGADMVSGQKGEWNVIAYTWPVQP